MKTCLTIWNIIFIIFIALICVLYIIDFIKTTDDVEISPGELKKLKRTNFILIMFLGAWIIFEHVDRLFS